MADLPPLNLPEILAAHAQWLLDPATGQRANLRDANLRDAYLIDANLIDANLIGANLRGAYLIGANLRDAYLIDANLIGANLIGANLRDANLIGANLRDADLIGANLRGVNLQGANLIGANLRDADLSGILGLAIAADAPQRLRATATAALADGALEMKTWRSRSTTHCLSDWLIHQAGEVGRLLEAAVGPEVAGLMLGGIEAHGHFYDDNEAATEWLRSVVARPEVEA
jgi:hypothetical protein